MVEQMNQIFVFSYSDDMVSCLVDIKEIILIAGNLSANQIDLNILNEITNREIIINKVIFEIDDISELDELPLLGLEYDFDIKVNGQIKLADIFKRIDKISKENVRLVLPLTNDSDYELIKILSSLNVHILVDIQDPRTEWENLNMLVTETILSMVPKGILDPVTMLSNINDEDGLDLSNVYFNNPKDYIWVSNPDEHSINKAQSENIKKREKVERANIDTMINADSCSFCVGFYLCKGYLKSRSDLQSCAAFFENLVSTLDIKKNKVYS